MRIAVIGSGISGLSSAWLLQQKHEVRVYEQDQRPGGHSHTIDVDYDGTRVAIDTGFMVYNELTYPNLVRLFKELDVETKTSSMTFSASIDDGRIEYAGTSLDTVFAQRRNLLRPGYLRMLADIVRFNRRGSRFLDEEKHSDITIGQFLDGMGASASFRAHYLYPMAGSIWSAPTGSIENFPAQSFLRFFANHGLLTVAGHPTWRTLEGGSRQYVRKIMDRLGDRLLLNRKVIGVSRSSTGGVDVVDSHGITSHFDAVVMASHSDQSLAMLTDATDLERKLLGAVRYQPNTAIVHRDETLMPKRRKVWSSWNYHASVGERGDQGVSLTYWMNSLQGVDSRLPIFVSINPQQMPAEDKIFKKMSYSHPIFDQSAIEAQQRIGEIQGKTGVWFAGAWLGYGFHEDGIKSAVAIARALGVRPPWEEPRTPAGAPRSMPAEAPASMPQGAVASPDF